MTVIGATTLPGAKPSTRRALARTATMSLVVLGYLLVAAVFLAPLLWMLSTSFKQPDEVFARPQHWFPRSLSLVNYTSAWKKYDFNRYALNSMLVAGAVTALQVVLSCLAGFGLAKYRFAGRRLALLAILTTVMLPLEALMVPMYVQIQGLGWLNTYQGLILPSAATGMGVFIMRQFIASIPDSLIESARLDGANDLTILARVILPLCKPAVATVAILVWRETWDEFLWPFIAVSDEPHRTLPLGVALFQQNFQTNYGQLMAISIITSLPLLILFVIFQRSFVSGNALTGMKG